MRIREVTRLNAIDDSIPVLPQTMPCDKKWKAHTVWRDQALKALTGLVGPNIEEGKTTESLFEKPNVYRMSNDANIIDLVITTMGLCYLKVVTKDGGLLLYIEARPHDVE